MPGLWRRLWWRIPRDESLNDGGVGVGVDAAAAVDLVSYSRQSRRMWKMLWTRRKRRQCQILVVGL